MVTILEGSTPHRADVIELGGGLVITYAADGTPILSSEAEPGEPTAGYVEIGDSDTSPTLATRLNFEGAVVSIAAGVATFNFDARYQQIGANVAWSQVTARPTSLNGYGIIDAYTRTELQTPGQADFNAANATSGTLPDARLSTTIPRLNAANIFTAAQQIQGAAATSVFNVRVTGDAHGRLRALSDGELGWGPGSATQDTNLYRHSANWLRTDDAFSAANFYVGTTEIVATNRRLQNVLISASLIDSGALNPAYGGTGSNLPTLVTVPSLLRWNPTLTRIEGDSIDLTADGVPRFLSVTNGVLGWGTVAGTIPNGGSPGQLLTNVSPTVAAWGPAIPNSAPGGGFSGVLRYSNLSGGVHYFDYGDVLWSEIDTTGAPAYVTRWPTLGEIGAAAASHAHAAGDITSGTLGTARGGTGLSTYTAGSFLYASSASVIGQRTPAQVLADIAAVPTSRTITAGTGLTGGGNLTANRTISLALVVPSLGGTGIAYVAQPAAIPFWNGAAFTDVDIPPTADGVSRYFSVTNNVLGWGEVPGTVNAGSALAGQVLTATGAGSYAWGAIWPNSAGVVGQPIVYAGLTGSTVTYGLGNVSWTYVTDRPVFATRWPTFAEVTSRPTTLAGYGISDAYTQAQITTFLAGKSDTGHTHAASEITGFFPELTVGGLSASLPANLSVLGGRSTSGTMATLTIGNVGLGSLGNNEDFAAVHFRSSDTSGWGAGTKAAIIARTGNGSGSGAVLRFFTQEIAGSPPMALALEIGVQQQASFQGDVSWVGTLTGGSVPVARLLGTVTAAQGGTGRDLAAALSANAVLWWNESLARFEGDPIPTNVDGLRRVFGVTNGTLGWSLASSGSVDASTSQPGQVLQSYGTGGDNYAWGIALPNSAPSPGLPGVMRYSNLSGGVHFADWGAVDLAVDVSGTLPVARGGTGLATITAGRLMVGNGLSAPTLLAPGTAGQVVRSNGTTWLTAALALTDTTGTLAANRGGTGLTSYTTGYFLRASGSATLAQRSPAQVLSDIGAAAESHTHDAGEITSGNFSPSRGGTGLGTLTSGALMIGNGASAVQFIAGGAARRILVASSATSWTSRAMESADLPQSPAVTGSISAEGEVVARSTSSNPAYIGVHPSYPNYASFWRGGNPHYTLLANVDDVYLNANSSTGNVYVRRGNADVAAFGSGASLRGGVRISDTLNGVTPRLQMASATGSGRMWEIDNNGGVLRLFNSVDAGYGAAGTSGFVSWQFSENVLSMYRNDGSRYPYMEWVYGATRGAFLGWGTPGQWLDFTLENGVDLRVAGGALHAQGDGVGGAGLIVDRAENSDGVRYRPIVLSTSQPSGTPADGTVWIQHN